MFSHCHILLPFAGYGGLESVKKHVAMPSARPSVWDFSTGDSDCLNLDNKVIGVARNFLTLLKLRVSVIYCQFSIVETMK